MVLQKARMSSTVLTIIVLLMSVLAPLARGQDDRTSGGRRPLEGGGEAQELFQSASLLVPTKDWKLAHQQMQEAVRLWMGAGEPEKAARALMQMGYCSSWEQNYQSSLYFYKQVLEVRPLPGPIRADAYNAIAQVYAELSSRDLAMDYFTKAAEQARRSGDRSALAMALSGMADLYHRQGETEKALAKVAEARQLNLQKVDEAADAALLRTAGELNQEEGRLDQSKSAFEQALSIYKKTSDVEGQIKVLCSMSDLSLLASEKQAALAQAMEAVELAEGQAHRATTNADKTRARDLRWRAWLRRARAERATGQKELAAKSYRSALTHVAALWWLVKISTEMSAITFRQETQALYREYVDLLIEQGHPSDAYAFADSAKARAIRGITEARRRSVSTGQGAHAETLRELYRSIARLRTQWLSSGPGVEREKLQREICDEEYALEERRVQTEIENARDRIIWSEPATVESLQARMAQDKSALLEYLLGEKRSFAWLITPNGVSSEILPSRREIEITVRQYLESLTTAPNNLHLETEIAKSREQSAALFSVLFGKLAGQIAPGQKLIVVPDGLLHYLPFETLIHDARYLIEDHEISYNASASMLGLWQDPIAQPKDSKKMEVLAFGDPVFEPRSSARNDKRRAKSAAQVADPLRSANGYALTPLPRTRDEVQYIASLFTANRCHVYLGKESTEGALKRESLRDYRRLHFATHSLIDEQVPSRSAVVFTLDGDPLEDGFLDVGEISELDLDCDIVVLSACQTGRGTLFSGEGIVGLSRAFLSAGARSVLVSLWNVSDISTSNLMKSFYSALAGNAGNGAALREAKLQMIGRANGLQHPYYWASFILIGRP